MKTLIFIFVILFTNNAYSTYCANITKNCVAVSAELEYLYETPVCAMTAECDRFCGTMYEGRRPTKFYCAFKSTSEKGYLCLPVEECKTDTSVVSSQNDVDKLTKIPMKKDGSLVVPAPKGKR